MIMRRLIVALAALLITSSAYAAFGIFQTYSVPAVPQITCNIVTGVGSVNSPCVSPAATCGGLQEVTKVVSITSAANVLTTSTSTFAPGDVGKYINVPGAGSGGGNLLTTISGYTSATQVALTANASTTLTSSSKLLTFGIDDAAAFRAFNTWARANQGANNQVVLTVPNGAVCYFASNAQVSGTTLFNAWAAGIKNLIVEGAGARITGAGGAGFSLGGQGIIQIGLTQATGKSARIQSVSAGATQAELTSASYSAGYISRFSVGQVIMFGGVDLQGLWNTPYGFPPNFQYWEWRKITAICNNTGPCTGTATITVDQPLTNSYLSTWPQYNEGNGFEVDNGGPATIYAINDTWDMTAEYRGLTISNDGQTYAGARNITYRDVVFTGAHAGIPTQNETWSAYNTDFGLANMEVDKLINTMTMDTVTIGQIKFQSSSTNLFVGRNLTVTNNITGSPKNTDISDSIIANWGPGAYAYGASTGYTKCTRCDVANFTGFTGALFQNDNPPYSMSSGVISFPNTSVAGSGPPSRIWVPGGNVFWATTGYSTAGLFQGQSITQDPTNVYVQTSEAGGFPSLISAAPQFRTHPAPQFTCDACTGDPKLVAANIQRGATPLAPLGTYSSRDFAPTGTFKNTSPLQMRGKLVSLSINVTQAYTGTGAAILNPTGEFTSSTVKQSDWSSFAWWPTINLKQTGERIIVPGGVTCDGVPGPCSGDTINSTNGYPPEAVWLVDGINPSLPSSLSGGGTLPLFTLILQTDQGVVP